MVKRLTLKNGIRIILEYMPILETVSVGFFFITGSANETEKENGYSHFIEHMLFKGTNDMTSKEIVRYIEGVGGVFNAYTSRHFTSFYINIISKYFDRAIDTLSNIALNSAFREEDIKKEKKVIIEELKMTSDSPEEIMTNQFFEKAYKGTSMQFPIGGNIKNIKNISRDKILTYFKNHFNSNNLIVSIAGNFNVKSAIYKLSSMELKQNILPANEELPFFYKSVSKEKSDLNQVYFALITPSYSACDKRKYTMNIVNDIFGGSSYSRLFQSIRENKALCYSIYSNNSAFLNGGTFDIFGSTSLDRYEKTVTSIYDEIERLLDERITKEELEEAKESYKSSMSFSKFSASFAMNKNARNELYFSKYVSYKDLYNTIDKININDINKAIEDIFQDKKFFLTAVGPKGTKKITDKVSKKLKLN